MRQTMRLQYQRSPSAWMWRKCWEKKYLSLFSLSPLFKERSLLCFNFFSFETRRRGLSYTVSSTLLVILSFFSEKTWSLSLPCVTSPFCLLSHRPFLLISLGSLESKIVLSLVSLPSKLSVTQRDEEQSIVSDTRLALLSRGKKKKEEGQLLIMTHKATQNYATLLSLNSSFQLL